MSVASRLKASSRVRSDIWRSFGWDIERNPITVPPNMAAGIVGLYPEYLESGETGAWTVGHRIFQQMHGNCPRRRLPWFENCFQDWTGEETMFGNILAGRRQAHRAARFRYGFVWRRCCIGMVMAAACVMVSH